ncbi:hypothetical protein HXX76_002182 [Chlamydomonas incerta]|uniref:Uncharacterized protein n=1 Tax=Chlamydomonas incerta TaxID=51695 RepID=A0A835WAM2_CHLIN|nr:hypothetical protein HXX76_002182 [Chlamydomonas incerta]|eukprot:KAG2443839.1 hypothetical protein HXX76_002182 [Chlamydomonas incerta]
MRASERGPSSARIASDAVKVVVSEAARSSVAEEPEPEAVVRVSGPSAAAAAAAGVLDSDREDVFAAEEQLESRRLSSLGASTSASSNSNSSSTTGGFGSGNGRGNGNGNGNGSGRAGVAAGATGATAAASSAAGPSWPAPQRAANGAGKAAATTTSSSKAINGSSSSSSPVAFPVFPPPPSSAASAAPLLRPPGASPPASGSSSSSSPGGSMSASSSLDVPPEAVALYAGTPVAGNLSATVVSSDALVPAIDQLQLLPPAPPGVAPNAQRVYKSVPEGGAGSGSSSSSTGSSGSSSSTGSSGGSSSTSAGADAGAAAAAAAVKRRRAKVRVLDASEVLLARDEAVRTELLGRTWKDLLQFEERLGAGLAGTAAPPAPPAAPPAGQQQQPQQQQQQTAGAAAPSLDELLGLMQAAAAATAGGAGAAAAAAATAAGAAADAEFLESKLLGLVRRAGSWQQLRRLYRSHRERFGPAHLTATLTRLSQFWKTPGEVVRADRAEVLALWDELLEQVAFSAPDLTGQQAVAVAGALAALPFAYGPRVEATLAALQRVLRYSSHAVVPAAAAPPPKAAASTVAAAAAAASRLRGGAAGPLSSVDGGAGPAAEQQQQQRSGPAPPPSDMRGGSYARLLYVLGRINAAARPWRMSIRLPPAYIRGLLLGSYAALAPAAPPPSGAGGGGAASAGGGLRPKDYAHMLYGLACMRVSPPVPWLYAFYVTSARAVPAMNDTELSMLLYGACRIAPAAAAGAPAAPAAAAAAKPPAPWIEACLEQFARRFTAPRPAPRAGSSSSSSSGNGNGNGSSASNASASNGTGGSIGVQEVDGGSGSSSSGAGDQGYVGMDGAALAGVVLALGRLRYKPRRAWLDAHLAASGAALAAGRLSPTEMSHLVRGYAFLGVTPPDEWLAALWETSGTALMAAAAAAAAQKQKRAQQAAAAAAQQAPQAEQAAAQQQHAGKAAPQQQWAKAGAASTASAAGGATSSVATFSPAMLADLAWALGLLKVPLPRRWYAALLAVLAATPLEALRPYHRRRLLAALAAFECADLQRWYEHFRIPLKEMPGYSDLRAAATQRRVQAARAALLAERRQQQQQQQQAGQQGAGSQAAGVEQKEAAAAAKPVRRPKGTKGPKRQRPGGKREQQQQ